MRLCRHCKRLFAGDQARCPDDDSATVEVAVEAFPEELAARFPEREPLAQGGTGTLYLIDRLGGGGIEGQLGPQLVLKVLAAELTLDPAERTRHRRDLRKQQTLVHPQLPRVLDEGETASGRVWFTREYVPGTSLTVRLKNSGALASDAALSVMVQLAAALDGLHQLGLVHRDLKPGHVLLRAPQTGSKERISLQLIDATLAAPLTAEEHARRGTADYAAKEIVEGVAGTVRSDLYALGCLSYELLTGAPPFRGASQSASDADTEATLTAQRNAEPKPLPDKLPEAVRTVITSMLSKDARRRPFSAQQVRRAIEPLLLPSKPAARSGARSALQREAAALRLTGSTAKPVAPATFPDATVELDVNDLDEAIEAGDEPEQNETRAPGVQATKKAAVVEDSAPTIALTASTLKPQPTATVRSEVTPTHTTDKSATVSNAGGASTNYDPHGEPRTAPGIGIHSYEPSAAESGKHQPSASNIDQPLAPEATAANASAPETSSAALAGESSAGRASAREASSTSRTGESSKSASAARAQAREATNPSFSVDAARDRAATVSNAPETSSPSLGGESSGAAAPRASEREATNSSLIDAGRDRAAVGAEARDAANVSVSGEGVDGPSAAPVKDAQVAGSDGAVEAPRPGRTETKFGLGPVRMPDIEAAALAAEVSAERASADVHAESATRSAYQPVQDSAPASAQPSTPQLSAASAAPPGTRPKRYSSSPKALSQSPRLLLVAAGGLVALLIFLRMIFGPAESARSPAVVVHVPEATTELAIPSQPIETLSEQALIGGDIPGLKRVPLTAAAAEPSAAAPAAAQPAQLAQTTPEPENADDEPEAQTGGRDVPTVSAVSVKGGVARSASTRHAATTSGSATTQQSAPDYKAKARELYNEGKYREAATAYQRATQYNASDAAAYAGLGGSLLATGNTRKAIQAYQRAVHLEPDVSGFQAALGRAYLKKGDRTRARAAYTKALQLDPNNHAARTGMANAKAASPKTR